MNVDTASLESMCELIVDCPHSTPKWTDSGVVVLRNQNIRNGQLELSSPSYTNEAGYQSRVKRAVPQVGDIIFTREAPMGEVCLIPSGLKCCLGQRQVLLRPKETVNGEYLYWALQSPFVQHQISWNEGTGTTVSNVRIPVLKSLQIPRRGSDEQKIADALSSLAHKIRLNHQINQTLEQIAQALFKSWFVDFEPVKAKIAALETGGSDEDALLAAMQAISGTSLFDADASAAGTEAQLARLQAERPEQYAELRATAKLFPSAMQDSELGEIPEGWEVKPLSEMIKLIGGGTPKKSEPSFWNGKIHWFSIKDIPAEGNVFVIDTTDKITDEGLKRSSTRLLPVGTTIITARGTVGKLALTGVATAMNQSCYGVIGSEGTGPYLNYLRLHNALDTLKQNTHGAVFDTITQSTFETVIQSLADLTLRERFERTVEPLFKQIKNNLIQSKILSETRDLLLPKLLSGELSVSDTDARLAEVEEPANV